MALQYPIPEELNQTWGGARSWLENLLGNIFDPNRQSQPPPFGGINIPQPQSLPQMMADMLMEKNVKESYSNIPLSLVGLKETPTPDTIIANRTGISKGAMNRPTKVTQWVKNNILPKESLLDFGAGKYGNQTRILREEGFDNITAHDFGNNLIEGIHDINALDRQYQNVMASNVLNVQNNKNMLETTIKQIADSTMKDGQAILNYPKEPRYPKENPFTVDEILNVLNKYFDKVEKVGGSSTEPIWRCSQPKVYE